MVGLIDTLFDLGQKLFGLKLELSKAKLARKTVVASFLDAIAQSLEDTSAQLKINVYPHGKCQELLIHSQNMEEAIGDLVGQTMAHDLALQLAEVHQVERLYGEISSDSEIERHRKLTVLDMAAGQFRATAAFVKVSV